MQTRLNMSNRADSSTVRPQLPEDTVMETADRKQLLTDGRQKAHRTHQCQGAADAEMCT